MKSRDETEPDFLDWLWMLTKRSLSAVKSVSSSCNALDRPLIVDSRRRGVVGEDVLGDLMADVYEGDGMMDALKMADILWLSRDDVRGEAKPASVDGQSLSCAEAEKTESAATANDSIWRWISSSSATAAKLLVPLVKTRSRKGRQW